MTDKTPEQLNELSRELLQRATNKAVDQADASNVHPSVSTTTSRETHKKKVAQSAKFYDRLQNTPPKKVKEETETPNEGTLRLVEAIISGKASEIEQAFSAAMADRLMKVIDARELVVQEAIGAWKVETPWTTEGTVEESMPWTGGYKSASKRMKEAEKARSHQEKTTMKHIKKPTAGEKTAAKDIKPGIAGYADRIAMLKSAEKEGRLKEEAGGMN